MNSCWELYGVKNQSFFPSTGSKYLMRTTTEKAGAVQWDTHWNALLENGLCANASISESHTSTQQDVRWTVHDPPY